MTTEQFFNYVKNVAVLIGIITPLVTLGGWVAHNLKQDILNEFRNEAAMVRTEFLRDVEERYDDISFEIHKLEKLGQPVPEYLISKQKRLERRMESLRTVK